MSVREIRLFGDPTLNSVAAPVKRFDKSLCVLVDDMLETMDAAGGVGLAANQIGVTSRVFVFSCQGMRGHIINPFWTSDGTSVETGVEGCLSVPGVRGEISRYHEVIATGQDMFGRSLIVRGTGLLARCIQHETDHLDGIMFMRRMDPTARKEAMSYIRNADWFKET